MVRGVPRRWALGLMTPRRTLASSAFLPNATEQHALPAGQQPYWHVMNYSLAARGSDDSDILPDNSFTLLAILGSSTGVGRTQFYQVIDGESGARMSRVGVNFANVLGSAQNPFLLKKPYRMPDRMQLLNRTGDLSNAANTVQVVLFGAKEK